MNEIKKRKTIMKLSQHKCALAAGLSMIIVYSSLIFLASLWPKYTLKLAGQLFHFKMMGRLAPFFKVTALNFTSSIIQRFIYTYVYVWFLAGIYNWLIKE